MPQCNICEKKEIDESCKPFGDYFLCGCYGKRKTLGFGPELEHWNDLICELCSKEQKLCRTCGLSYYLNVR